MNSQIYFDKHKNLYSKSKPEQISLEDYLALVKSNHVPPYIKGTDEYDQIKRQLPVINVNGYFSGNPSINSFIRCTGYIFLELDYLDQDTIEETKLYWFNKYDWIVAAYKSLSNTGIHFIAKVDASTTCTIDSNKQTYFKSLLNAISTEYFNNNLDTQSFKLTQYTVTGSDLHPLFRTDPKGLLLEIDYKHAESKKSPSPNDTGAPDITGLCDEIFDFEFLTTQEKVSTILNHYPDIKDRMYWYSYDYGRLSENVKVGRTIEDEIINKKTFYDYSLNTIISDRYFNPKNVSYGYAVLDEPILTTKILITHQTKTGNRNTRLMAESAKLLFNNPFLSFDKFKDILLKFNSNIFDKPLSVYEIKKIAEYQYKLFISGKMIWHKEHFDLKKVFYPQLTVLDGKEKSKITASVTYACKREIKLKTIETTINELLKNGIKPTNDEISCRTGISKRSLNTLIPKSAKDHLIERVSAKLNRVVTSNNYSFNNNTITNVTLNKSARVGIKDIYKPPFALFSGDGQNVVEKNVEKSSTDFDDYGNISTTGSTSTYFSNTNNGTSTDASSTDLASNCVPINNTTNPSNTTSTALITTNTFKKENPSPLPSKKIRTYDEFKRIFKIEFLIELRLLTYLQVLDHLTPYVERGIIDDGAIGHIHARLAKDYLLDDEFMLNGDNGSVEKSKPISDLIVMKSHESVTENFDDLPC